MTSSTGAGVSAEPIDAADARKGVRDASLPARILSAVVFLPLLVLMAWTGGVVWLLFGTAVVGLGLREFYSLLEAKGLSPHWKSGMLAPSAAATVTSAGAAAADAIGRTYRGWSRRAVNQ